MDNITSRLRNEAEVARSSAGVTIIAEGLLTEAADEIERLKVRLKELEETQAKIKNYEAAFREIIGWYDFDKIALIYRAGCMKLNAEKALAGTYKTREERQKDDG